MVECVAQPGVTQRSSRARLMPGAPIAVERNPDQFDVGHRSALDHQGAVVAARQQLAAVTVDDHPTNIGQVGRNQTSSTQSAMESSTRPGRNGYLSMSATLVEPVSTRMVSSPASMPATTSVSIRSPTIIVFSECASMRLSALRNIIGLGLPT